MMEEKAGPQYTQSGLIQKDQRSYAYPNRTSSPKRNTPAEVRNYAGRPNVSTSPKRIRPTGTTEVSSRNSSSRNQSPNRVHDSPSKNRYPRNSSSRNTPQTSPRNSRPQPQQLNVTSQQNRSRSSSWPNRPLGLPESSSPTVIPCSRARSSTLSGDNNIASAYGRNPSSPGRQSDQTVRKKRKRLNPQRRSFYKALHTDFPLIADALREARQGTCVVNSLQSREIEFSTIEARPPQDPTNLNVRRYNDIVFIWDPNKQVWLQVPGNGTEMEQASPMTTADPSESGPSVIAKPKFPPSSLSPFSSHELPSFVFDSSEDEQDPDSRNLNEFLPMNIINDIL